MFKGAVSVRDSNLIASMEGEINLQPAKASYLLNGHIEHAHLEKLKLMKEAVQVSSGFELDLRFTSVDDLLGRAIFTDLNIQNQVCKICRLAYSLFQPIRTLMEIDIINLIPI